jgi:hypothetical protein
MKTSHFRVIGDASGDSANRKNYVGSFVSQLLFARSPTAILWIIIAVIILSVQGMTFGAFSHISQEVFKGFQPSWTDLYSASAVVVIAFLIWIAAATFHVRPRTVGSVLKISVPVCHARHIGGSVSQTAARSGATGCQTHAADFRFLAAFALAQIVKLWPSSARSAHWRICNYFKLSKGLTNQGYFRRHNGTSSTFMFSEARGIDHLRFTIIFNSLRNTMLSIAKSREGWQWWCGRCGNISYRTI